MLWDNLDLVAKEWRPYISKTDFHHIVPLSQQAVEILEAIKSLTGNGQYVFPSSRGDGRPMSDNTIRTALITLGYDSTIQNAGMGRLPGQSESCRSSNTVSQGCIIVQHRPVRYYHECNSL